jgi:hypothetical protein
MLPEEWLIYRIVNIKEGRYFDTTCNTKVKYANGWMFNEDSKMYD